MTQPTTIEINISNCNINVFRAGRGSKILFLHGGGGAGAWVPFYDRLSDKYEVIVPEHPGFGRSDLPEWLDNVADLAKDFIKALGLSAIHLVGHSLGGWIAADLATRNTSVLKTLTLISPAGIQRAISFFGIPKSAFEIFFMTNRLPARFWLNRAAMSNATPL
jgi:pimeloyl-ACP methyl ester carboxylesterase